MRSEESEDNTLHSDDDEEFNDDNARMLKKDMQRAEEVKQTIRTKLSRFYHNINVEEELRNDFDSDDLAEISEDEVPDDDTILYEDHKKIGQEHAKSIQTKMAAMTEIYDQMSTIMEGNMSKVQNYVEKLQSETGKDGDFDSVKEPDLVKLNGLIVNLQNEY